MSVVALVIAPSIALSSDTLTAYNEEKASTEMVAQEVQKEVRVEMKKGDDGVVNATVTTTTTENGEQSVAEEKFTGTEEEVKAKVEAYKGSAADVKINVKKVIEEVVEEEKN